MRECIHTLSTPYHHRISTRPLCSLSAAVLLSQSTLFFITFKRAAMHAPTLLSVLALVASATAKYECNKTPGPDKLPYCVNMPDKIPADSVNGKLPTILYLPGSGAFGSANDIATLVSTPRQLSVPCCTWLTMSRSSVYPSEHLRWHRQAVEQLPQWKRFRSHQARRSAFHHNHSNCSGCASGRSIQAQQALSAGCKHRKLGLSTLKLQLELTTMSSFDCSTSTTLFHKLRPNIL